MGLPTAKALAGRKAIAEEQLRRLREASDAFFRAWEAIEQEEHALQEELSAYVDKQKLKRIHDTIYASQ